MKFDEAWDKILENSIPFQIPDEAGDAEVLLSDLTDIFEELRKEYAPTIEMTEGQVDDLNHCVREVGEVFHSSEIPEDVKLTDKVLELESSYILFKYLNAILHPETIEVVDK